MTLAIRQATIADSRFVARCVAMALHFEQNEEQLNHMTSICRMEDVLYSYKNTLVAEVDGTLVGICLCYDGNGYHEIKERTFALFPDTADEMDFANFEDETQEGEYYIDSLAVLPEFRRQGIAKALMQAQIQKGREMGLPLATLLVDPDNPDAQKLYSSLGFKHKEDVYAFGQIYWKWTLPLV